MDVTITIDGLEAVLKAIAAEPAEVQQRAMRVLYEEATAILTDSQKNYVPVRDGFLRGSGIEVADTDAGSVSIEFGGPAAPYAVIVHEKVENFHKHGSAKYLEIPARARVPQIVARLREVLEERFKP